jgi:hypothetical protein
MSMKSTSTKTRRPANLRDCVGMSLFGQFSLFANYSTSPFGLSNQSETDTRKQVSKNIWNLVVTSIYMTNSPTHPTVSASHGDVVEEAAATWISERKT